MLPEFGRRQRFFEALARATFAAPQPLLLLLDDLQWCDQETLEWLHYLLRFDPAARLLIVGTVRAEELAQSGTESPISMTSAQLADLLTGMQHKIHQWQQELHWAEELREQVKASMHVSASQENEAET